MSELTKGRLGGGSGGPSAGYVQPRKQVRGSSRGADSEPGEPRLALSTSQVARRLGVSLGTVRRWADLGHLPAYRTPGGQRRFSSKDVETFVASLGGRNEGRS